MELISVIVPVYNVESYIGRCLDSLISQTYDELEIICVDDASTDNSLNICIEFAAKDPRIRVIEKDENSGVSATRNVGLVNSSGRYISFVDPDDWIDVTMYQKMIDTLKKREADMIVCSLHKVWPDKVVEMKNEIKMPVECFGKEQAYIYAFNRFECMGFGLYNWNKLYKRELIFSKDTTICFDEKMYLFEDIVFFVEVLQKTDKICYLDEPLYYYYQRENSLVHDTNLDRYYDSLLMYARVIEFFDKNQYAHSLISYAKRFYAFQASLILEKAIIKREYENIEKYKREMNKYVDEYLSTSPENHPEWNARILNLISFEYN